MVLDGATGNYVTVDNFRLTLNEPDPSTFATIHKELQAVVDQAKAISENLDTPEQKELDAATAAVEALIALDTTDGVAEAVIRLREAIYDYSLSVA